MSSKRWSNVTKIIVVAALIVIAMFLVVTFRVMIPPTIVTFLLAFILSYPVNWIQQRTGWSRGTTIASIYLVLLAIVTLTPALAIPRATDLFTPLVKTLQDLVMELQTSSGERSPFKFGDYELPFDMVLQNAGSILQNALSSMSTNPLFIVRGVTTGVLTVLYVLVLNFWLLKDAYKLQRFFMAQIPSDYQEDARRIGEELAIIWHAFLRGQLVLAFVVGTMTWIALTIVGMPNAGGLALLAGVMEFLPTIGPGISGAIGTTVAIFQSPRWFWMPTGIPFALLVLAIYIFITQIESVYLIPRLVGRRVRLHPGICFVGIISGALVLGVLGVLLATPVLASARTILSYIYAKLLDREPFEPSPLRQSSVRIRGLIAGRRIEAIIFDLDGTLTELDWAATDLVAERLYWLNRLISPERRRQIMRRIMIVVEGFVHFIISQLRRFQLQQDLNRMIPIFDLLRGYAPVSEMQSFPYSIDLLQRLSAKYRLALISTRSRADVESFLHKTGADNGLFSTILSQEDVRNLMPHSEALLNIAEQLAIDSNNILLVSDTDVNLRSGRASQMATAGVLNGLGLKHDMEDADLVLDNVTDLGEWL